MRTGLLFKEIWLPLINNFMCSCRPHNFPLTRHRGSEQLSKGRRQPMYSLAAASLLLAATDQPPSAMLAQTATAVKWQVVQIVEISQQLRDVSNIPPKCSSDIPDAWNLAYWLLIRMNLIPEIQFIIAMMSKHLKRIEFEILANMIAAWSETKPRNLGKVANLTANNGGAWPQLNEKTQNHLPLQREGGRENRKMQQTNSHAKCSAAKGLAAS